MTQFKPGNFQVLPVIVKNILIINGLVFLAQLTFDGVQNGGDLEVRVGFMANHFALHNMYSPLFRPWQIFTHMFMHGSLMHIFSNMFALWMFGSVLENIWGPRRFLLFYLVCGVGAALLHLGALWWENRELVADIAQFRSSPTLSQFKEFYEQYLKNNSYTGDLGYRIARAWEAAPQSNQVVEQAQVLVNEYMNASLNEPTLGASGAVFGCLAAFGFLFPNTEIYLYFFVPIKAKWFVIFYIAFELVMALRNSAGDSVARWAHLGGALVGLLLAYYWKKTNKRQFY